MVLVCKLIGRRSYITAALLPFVSDDHDIISTDSETTKEIIRRNENKTGWERVMDIFKIDEFDNLSPELTTVMHGSILGLFIGACYGGLNRSKLAYLDFITKNKATQFSSHFEAKKKLQDQVTIGMAKGGFQWGWRLGYFTGTYILTSTVVAAYRGKSGILEHVIGGGVAGGMYKFNLGVRGIAVGTALGCTLGGIAGVCSYSLLKITGYTMEELMYLRKQWRDTRRRKINENLSPYGGINEDPLVREYTARHKSAELLPKDN